MDQWRCMCMVHMSHTFSSLLSRSLRLKDSTQSLKHRSTRPLYMRRLQAADAYSVRAPGSHFSPPRSAVVVYYMSCTANCMQ